MAAPFPQLIPSQPSVVMPRHPHVAVRSTGGGESRIRLSNVRAKAQLTLAFEAIDTSQLIQLLAHWRNARGTAREFQIGATNLGAMAAAGRALLLSTTWKYASPPTCEDICGGAAQKLLHTVKVELISQPRRVAAYINPTAPELSVPVTPTVISGGALPARAAMIAGLISTADGWSLPGAALTTGQVWVTAGRFSAGGGDLIGGILAATASITGGSNTAGAASQPPSALGAGTSVSGGVFTLAGNMAGGTLSAGATMTGGALTIPLAWISLGANLSAEASLNPGLAGGGPSGRAFSAGATMVGGFFNAPQNGTALNSTATLAGGVFSGGSADPYFSSVSLLLPFNGTDGSTTIIDQSVNALNPASIVNATIATAQSKFGSSSAALLGNGLITYTPQSLLQFDGDFTLELHVYTLNNLDQVIGSSSSDGNTQIFRVNESGYVGHLSFYLNGSQVFEATAAGITNNTWHHLAICRSGTSTRMFANGQQVGATNTTWAGTFRFDVIGAFFFGGSIYGYRFNGYLDNIRVTKGIARYTSNFTPPTAPFPNS